MVSAGTTPQHDLPKLLVFILTYEAERHVGDVIRRIPAGLGDEFDVSVLLIDDASSDRTAQVAREVFAQIALPYPWTVFANPANQGYGGNQKLGYTYAVDNDFDVVVMLHGDGQYPPEEVGRLARLALGSGAAFGSRFGERGGARAGGMPVYKLVGNRILTRVQNRLLGTQLTEFHSGFRAYSTDTLRKIPFALNSNDFHFDTEIFIQCMQAGVEIAEMPIPTRYGDEECRVNGMRYARDVVMQSGRAKLHRMGLFYERKYDLDQASPYEAKLDFSSPTTRMVADVPAGSRVLDLGSSSGYLASALREHGCTVTGVDMHEPENRERFDDFVCWNLDDGLPPIEGPIDVVVLADVVEHLRAPERFVADLATFCADHATSLVLVSTGNVAFVVQRAMLAIGQFNYGRRGILDMTHTRLFTAGTLRHLFGQAGFGLERIDGVPAPFPLAVGSGRAGRAMLSVNEALIRISKRLFGYQLYAVLTPPPNLRALLDRAAGSTDPAATDISTDTAAS